MKDPALDPSGFLMGRGADTSMLLLTSMCSTLDTSMSISLGGRREEVVVVTSGKGGPRDQPSSPSTLAGLEKASMAARVTDLYTCKVTHNQYTQDQISMLQHAQPWIWSHI